jgi:hypothetical protein
VLPLALTTPHIYAGSKSFESDIVKKALTFDLIEGQPVNGSITYPGYGGVGHWCLFYFPNGSELGAPAAEIDANDGFVVTFNFIATIDGEYYVTFFADRYSSHTLDYSYSVGPSPRVFGVERTLLVGLVLAVGVVSALTVAVWGLRQNHTKKEN